jgi:ADP-ribose pyrophosphatase YjhB (NUDIX family)
VGEDERFSVAAYAVVTNERDEVLLTRRRDGGEWVLPGGSLGAGEAPWETVTREVREETGLELEEVRLTGIYAKRSERDLVLVFGAAGVRGARVAQTNAIASSSSIRVSSPTGRASAIASASATRLRPVSARF